MIRSKLNFRGGTPADAPKKPKSKTGKKNKNQSPKTPKTADAPPAVAPENRTEADAPATDTE